MSQSESKPGVENVLVGGDAPERKPVAPQKPKKSYPLPAEEVALVASLIDRAKSAREMRAAAPPVTVDGKVTIPQKEIINRVSKDTGGQDGDWHWTFQDHRDVDRLVEQAYEPGIDPVTGRWQKYEGDVLMRCRTEDFELSLKANKAKSDLMLRDKISAEGGRKQRLVPGSNVVSVETDEVTSVKKGDRELFAD